MPLAEEDCSAARRSEVSGARRGRAFKVTTRSDERQHRPDDLVEQRFQAPAPNRLWVADITYVTPAEFEAARYRQTTPAPEPVTQ